MDLLFLNLYKLLRNQTIQRKIDPRLLIEFEMVMQKNQARKFFWNHFYIWRQFSENYGKYASA